MENNFLKDLKDRDFLLSFIKEWNESRLDMFALSQPNEKLQFSGIMRFYFQDMHSGQKAATKCIRVNNEQTVADIMNTLIDKFCPDLKMLSTPNYDLFEIHGTGDVRKLDSSEKPLLVQLRWHQDDREGRFVLKSADLKIQPVKFFEINKDEGQLKRRLSRREKKDLKKKRKEELARNKNQDKLLADHVYRELPESSLTRTISNPEAVMRRRRQQKLEKRMKEFQNKGGPQTGGILKIFAESLKPEIPYKTILASVKDNADVITKAALEKFLLPNENPLHFCIIMAIIPPGDSSVSGNVKERVIRSSDCPLAIQNSWPRSKGVITFHLRRKEGVPTPVKKEERKTPKDKDSAQAARPRVAKKPPPPLTDLPSSNEDANYDTMPFFLELTPEGKEINYKPKIYHIRPHETVIGSSRNPSPGVQYLQLFSPKILASHCSIVNEDGCVSIVPHGPDADVRVSGKRIYDTMLLQSGNTIQFGGLHTFRFCNPLDAPPSHRSSIASEQEYRNRYGSQDSKGMSPPMSPISPELKELVLMEQVGSKVDDDLDGDQVTETTLGVDGRVGMEKIPRNIYSAKSVENLIDEETVQLRESFRNSFKKHRQSAPNLLSEENLLPASLTFLEHGKDAFFATVISEVNGAAVNFKLAPTYTLYLAARHVLSTAYRPGVNPIDRSRLLTGISKKIANSIQQTIQENDCLAGGLAFWMANASELLHFYRQDMDLGPLTQASQSILAQSIQESFALLVNAMEDELALALPAFLDPTESVDIEERDLDTILNDDMLERAESMELLNWTSEDDDRAFMMDPNGRPVNGDHWITPAARIRNHGMPIMADVLYILSSAMSLLRRCRVNAALTIQLFSQLFHYINMWIFNRIVLEPELNLCTRMWGHRLRMRLSFVEAWAERQGLELAADCHLARVVQAAYLLEAPKDSAEDIAEISSQCFKLNSLQLRCLLQNYMADSSEPIIPQDLIDTIVAVAESTADELTHSDGRDVKLEEDVQLQLPFLLPEEGYSSDIIRGVPPGLQEFLEPLCETGLCELSLNPASTGMWTVYQDTDDLEEDSRGNRDSQFIEEIPIQRITIDKGKSGLGLSICSAKGVHSDFPGIYIKAVISGGLADQDGRLEGGDQILSVNESSLIDVSQVQAAKIMGKCGSVITLEVVKGAAFYHGLAKLVEGTESPKIIKNISIDDNDPRASNQNEKGPKEYNEPPLPKREFVYNSDSPQSHFDVADNRPPQKGFDESRFPERELHNTAIPRYDHRHAKSFDGDQRIEPPLHRHTGSYDGSYYTERREEPRMQQQETSQPQYNDSDYDSDGNLMTPDEKSLRLRQLQRQREYEERIAKWEEERLRKEAEERKQHQLEEEEAERAYEEESRRVKQAEEERYREEKYREELERRKAEERRREEERLKEEQRVRAEQLHFEEQARLEEKKKEEQRRRAEQQRLEEEKLREEERLREESRIKELERVKEAERKRAEEEQARVQEERRAEEERRIADMKRREEERRRAEEYRRREEERKQQEEKDRRDADEHRRRLDAMRAEEKQKREQAEQERKRQEKLHLIEERKRKETEEAEERRLRKEQIQRENEEKRRKHYEEEVARRQTEKEQREKKHRKEEEERLRRADAERKREEDNKRVNETFSNSSLESEIAGIDEAMREAERIAAEMDLFMMEEEIKINETKQQKRQEEKEQWKKNTPIHFGTHQLNAAPVQKTYRIQNVIKRTSSRENLLETNLDDIENIDTLPPPPEDLLSDDDNHERIGNVETNIDDSSDEEDTRVASNLKTTTPLTTVSTAMHEQQRWLQQQKEKKERQKQEQQKLHQSYASRLDNVKQPPPDVRPKTFKPPSNANSAVRVEFQLNAENDYERKRHDSDKISRIQQQQSTLTVNNKTQRKTSSDDEDAPPRPPPPKSVTPSPRAPHQFTYSTTNGYQDYERSASVGKRPTNDHNSNSYKNSGTKEPEVMDFRTKMKMFNKFQNQ